MSGNSRIPPIQCLLTFEALARLRSVTQAAEELCVTPSAVSHRVKQLEQIIGTKLFGRADFSLTTEGNEYLAHVREGLVSLQRFPSASNTPGRRKLRLAVTPTFARSVLMPRLKHFLDAYPEIDITLQVSIPLLDVVAEDADLTVRFGTGRYSDVEHICLAKDDVTPLASPAWLRENGPFARRSARPTSAAQPPGALAHLVRRARPGLARTHGRLLVQRHWPDVRRRRPRPGHRTDPHQTGCALGRKRPTGASV
jgi:DNA-binding transcriptional LysR family regulator